MRAMRELKIWFRRLIDDERGQNPLEYLLALGFVAAAAAALFESAITTPVRIICAILAVILFVFLVRHRRRPAELAE